jgi:sRNA-binding regulator protein Hfq
LDRIFSLPTNLQDQFLEAFTRQPFITIHLDRIFSLHTNLQDQFLEAFIRQPFITIYLDRIFSLHTNLQNQSSRHPFILSNKTDIYYVYVLLFDLIFNFLI